MDKDTARAIADLNKRMLTIQKTLTQETESERTYRIRFDDEQVTDIILAQQTITDLDIADIISEQAITDLDLRILELEV